MTLTVEQAARLIIGAVGLTPAEVPPRPFGADWFREQEPWLAMSASADRLVQEPALDLAVPLSVAAALLEVDEEDDDDDEGGAGEEGDEGAAGSGSEQIVQLVEIGFVEAMVCSASHREDGAEERILAACPASVWQVWHRRRERLEALSDQRLGEVNPPTALEHSDANVSMMARCTTYKAESGRYVVLARVVSADRPSPWPLRHPVLIGLVFLAVLCFFFTLSLLTG